jgi:hypothetical protein
MSCRQHPLSIQAASLGSHGLPANERECKRERRAIELGRADSWLYWSWSLSRDVRSPQAAGKACSSLSERFRMRRLRREQSCTCGCQRRLGRTAVARSVRSHAASKLSSKL